MLEFELFPTKVEGVRIIKNKRFDDDRGSFEVSFGKQQFEALGLPTEWVQDNVSLSYQGVLRGMHIQTKNPQAKLIRCVMGGVWDCWVDLRPESKTFKKWGSLPLVDHKPEAIYLPPGLAHGFFCMSRFAVVQYKCTTLYDKESDGGIYYKDKEIGIEWPYPYEMDPLVSPKDDNLPSVAEYLEQLR